MNYEKHSHGMIKLPDMGIYVTSFDSRGYYSPVNDRGGPTLDPDGCIDWIELPYLDPAIKEILFGGLTPCCTSTNVSSVKK